ncbi:hypothetical protein ASE60_08555 [Ensifer sp. Root278]|nr:hypothetical protein ASE60_08555 [Ensifer sp. Root278]
MAGGVPAPIVACVKKCMANRLRRHMRQRILAATAIRDACTRAIFAGQPEKRTPRMLSRTG